MRSVNHRRPRLVAAAASLVVAAAACGGGAAERSGAEPLPTPTAAPNAATAMGESAVTDDPGADDVETAGADVAADPRAAARERCLAGHEALERRIDAEGFEWPEDGPELSEEELERRLAPEFPNVDGVAAPDERAAIDPMPAFDPETVSIVELDWLVGGCVEGGIVTERELFGDDDEGAEAEDDGDWCDELAALAAADVAEFAAEDGEDLVRAEFTECGLADPFSG